MRSTSCVILFFILLTSIAFHATGAVAGSYEQPLAGFAWSPRQIPVVIQKSPQYAHDAVLQAMQAWNLAQTWFSNTYHVSSNPYTFVEVQQLGTSYVNVVFNQTQTRADWAIAAPYWWWNDDGVCYKITVSISIDLSVQGGDLTSRQLRSLAALSFGVALGISNTDFSRTDLMNWYSVDNGVVVPSTLNLYAVALLSMVATKNDMPKSPVTLPADISYEIPTEFAITGSESTTQWEFQFYRLSVPSKVFFSSLPPEQAGQMFWIPGSLPSGLLPALGTIDKVEDQPGKFEENEGYIFLHMRGNLSADSQGLDFVIHAPKGEGYMTYSVPGKVKGGSYASVEATVWIIVFTGTYPLGIWRVDGQTMGSRPQTLFNASFTVGKYFADVSTDGLPGNVGAGLHLDGVPVGEVKGNASIALGWLPEHTITMQDVSLGQRTSRYHLSQPELKVSGPGQYRFQYMLQHYLSVESPYPVNASGWYDHGKTVLVSAPAQEASKDARAIFRSWSGNYSSKDAQISVLMDSPKHILAQYVTQYLLTVVSPVGNPQGSGWYDAGSSAIFSVTSPATEGIMGMLGGKHIFDRWSGDSNIATTTASVTMDGPKMVVAEWGTDNTTVYAVLLAIGAMAIVVAVLLVRRRKTSAEQAVHK